MTTISFEATFGAGPNIEREVQRRLHIPKIPELHLPEVSDDELSDIVPRYNDLIPLGDTGLHITPNDPVDPWDCDAWPDSPYCEGGGLVVDPIGGRGVGGVADVAGDECEICVTVTPSILWMRGPVYTVCYRKPECRPEGDTPEVDNSDIEDGIPQDAPQAPVAPDGYCRVLWAWHDRGIRGNDGNTARIDNLPGAGGGAGYPQTWTYTAARPYQQFGVQRVTTLTVAFNCRQFFISGRLITLCDWERTQYFWYDYPLGEMDPFTNPRAFEKKIYDSCGAAPPAPAPPYRPGGPDMSCNCGEMEDLLRAIHTRLGCNQFPMEVPQTLYGRGNKTENLQDVPSFFAWMTYQFDALIGEWPIQIEIEDEDPTTLRNQTRQVELPNLAEATAELFGLTYKSDITNDVLMELFLRLIPEIIGIKNSSLITQDYAKANASWLGYKGNPVKRKVPYNFDAEKLDSLPELMTTCQKEIIGWQDDDSEDLVSYLQRLMFSAGIIKAAFMRDKNQVSSYLDSLKNIWQDLKQQDSGWDEFIRRVDNPEDPINRGAIPKPDADKTNPGAVDSVNPNPTGGTP
jgi:hypothetical protein